MDSPSIKVLFTVFTYDSMTLVTVSLSTPVCFETHLMMSVLVMSMCNDWLMFKGILAFRPSPKGGPTHAVGGGLGAKSGCKDMIFCWFIEKNGLFLQQACCLELSFYRNFFDSADVSASFEGSG